MVACPSHVCPVAPSNQQSMVTVHVERPRLPSLWLDTSVVIKFAKLQRGEALQPIEVNRLSRLKTLTRELVQAEKLLCPEADQRDEYRAERLEEEVESEFTRISLGIHLRHRQAIIDIQTQHAMSAYCAQRDTITLPLTTFFH